MPTSGAGERLFGEAKCAVCHVPEMKAGVLPGLPQIEGQVFRAYTDLLLHDMGEELADGRPDFKAGPRDWRTPPLWGLGLSHTVSGSTAMLHDGRARNRHRSHPLARRRSADRTRGVSKHAEGGSRGAAEVPLLDLKWLLG